MTGDAISFFNWIRGSVDGIERDYDRRRTPSIIVVGPTRESLRAHYRYLGGTIAWYRERIEALR